MAMDRVVLAHPVSFGIILGKARRAEPHVFDRAKALVQKLFTQPMNVPLLPRQGALKNRLGILSGKLAEPSYLIVVAD